MRRQEEEKASHAGPVRAERLSHSPARSQPPGANPVLMEEQERGARQQLSASHAHMCSFRACFETLRFAVAGEMLHFFLLARCLSQEQ